MNKPLMSVETIRLRACEPEDLELLYRWENDPAYWCGDELRTPYSRYVLKQFILRAGQSVYESRQMRFMAVREADGLTVGVVDLYDFDPHNSRAGVGILIDQPYQGRGLATASLLAVRRYAFDHLRLHQLYAHIAVTNGASLRVFEKAGFTRTALLRDWMKRGDAFVDVAVMQVLESK